MRKDKQISINKINAKSLHDLKKVLVCPPDNFKMIKPINHTEVQSFKTGIDLAKLIAEHEEFCMLLEKHGIEAIKVPLLASCPQQTFTRDIGFVYQNTLFLANLSVDMRKDEPKAIKAILGAEVNCYEMQNNLEGGDVIVYKDTIFVGISDRTCKEAIAELEALIPNATIVPIKLKKHILHLDTVINFVGDLAVIYPKGIAGNFKVKKYFKHIIKVRKKDQGNLPTNFLALSRNKIIASALNEKVNKKIASYGIEVVLGGFEEMLKLGGSYRCCSLGIIRN